jgi:hypothetical protein
MDVAMCERIACHADDELDLMDGKRDDFLGRLQERYGITREDAERQVEEFHRLRLQSDEARKIRY